MVTGDLGAPVLVPARMLNEFIYCPRLFFFEWVEGRWADNDDTQQGTAAHRSVDNAGGSMAEPQDDRQAQRVFSVSIEDEELGVAAVIDRVDHDDGWCSAIEYKKGRATREGEMWLADRIQVLAHAALLHRAGYRVRTAGTYYRGEHRRVEIDWHDGYLDEVRATVADARCVSEQETPPLPLLDSAKCPRCSLVGLCLPDETNLVLQRRAGPPRAIVPRNPDERPVYVSHQGARVGVSGGRLTVKAEGETLTDVRLIDVSHLTLVGNVQISAQALSAIWRHSGVVLWMSYGGWLRGWAQGQPSRYVDLRRAQVLASSSGGAIAGAIIQGKIRNQRTLLRRNAKTEAGRAPLASLSELADKASQCVSLPSLLGFEGTAARLYFGVFTSMLNADAVGADQFRQNGRRRRPAPDPVNALLGLCYSLLVKDCVVTCLAVGLDPYVGVLHRERYGRPALALDLAEEFRPLIADSVVLQVLNSATLTGEDFSIRHLGTELTTAGRRKVIRAYERRMEQEVTHPVFGYRITYRRVLEVQARLLAAVMVGELPEYAAMVTR